MFNSLKLQSVIGSKYVSFSRWVSIDVLGAVWTILNEEGKPLTLNRMKKHGLWKYFSEEMKLVTVWDGFGLVVGYLWHKLSCHTFFCEIERFRKKTTEQSKNVFIFSTKILWRRFIIRKRCFFFPWGRRKPKTHWPIPTSEIIWTMLSFPFVCCFPAQHDFVLKNYLQEKTWALFYLEPF